MKMKDLKKIIKSKILDYGFDIIGFSKPKVEKKTQERYLEFLHKNFHGDMRWLERHFEKKVNPKKIWGKVETIVVIGLNYTPRKNPININNFKSKANISVYAQNEDYHTIIKEKLKKIQFWLANDMNIDSKIFVDTSPILEKYFAEKANIGWQGKHTNLVSKDFGSWLFLAEIFLPIKIYDYKKELNSCGSCVKCIDICPTQALLGDNIIDARKCISYLTIEHKGPIPFSLRRKIGNKVYGCDDCLSICPWNKFSKVTKEQKLLPKENSKSLLFFLKFNEEKFKKYFYNSPIKRIGWVRFLRNIIIASGNSKNKNLIKYLNIHLKSNNSLIRGASIWSLFQLVDDTKKEEIKNNILMKEKNQYVLFELKMLSQFF